MINRIDSCYTLPTFEGPLDLLYLLVQNEEIEIFDLGLQELSAQLLKKLEEIPTIDQGAAHLWLISTLLLIKSRKLLPSAQEEAYEEEGDPRLTLMEHLIEYQRIKEAAEKLIDREEEQSLYFSRNPPMFSRTKSSGLENVQLSDLAFLLGEMLELAKLRQPAVVDHETWSVKDQMNWLLATLLPGEKISFCSIFSSEKCRNELIVNFLALLELIKNQTFSTYKENNTILIKRNEKNE
ncbi:MAG: segregation/condensation protein A [Chlamydiia bacterium]|nr:segregation/condensation protein A [Chlamydiia bacterium]